MSTTLPPTNMTAAEMVPDTVTPGHDPGFWCLPPTHYDPNVADTVGGGYEYHLVTRGRKVGIWRNWSLAQAMVSGFPNSAHKGHHTYAACKEEWQRHCLLGVHPHPPAPTTPQQPAATPQQPAATSGFMSSPAPLWGGHQPRQPLSPARNAAPSSIGSVSSITTSSVASSGRSRPRRSTSAPGAASPGAARGAPRGLRPRYYAIWGGGVVFSTRDAAKREFDVAVEGGQEPQLMSTEDFDAALEYAEGVDM